MTVYLATAPSRPPAHLTGDGRIPLRLDRIVTRSFGPTRPYDDDMLRFFGDLAELYGLPYERAHFAQRARTTFTDMAAGVLDELRDTDTPVGLVVLAHHTPDGEPNWPASFLTGRLPGGPLAFAVADQGPVAPFTALRIASGYVRADGMRRAIVLILDQTTMLRDRARPAGAPPPAQNRVVALILDEHGALGDASVSTVADIAVQDVERALGRPEDDRSAVVLGASLARRVTPPAGAECVPAVDGLPCTGSWEALARGLDRWRSAGVRRVVVAEYDEPLRCLGRFTVNLGLGGGNGAAADRSPSRSR